jgi:hypothetical protein
MKHKPFEPGNTMGRGRPKNARNKLARRVLEELLLVWDEPLHEHSTVTRGKAALRVMSRERPAEFCKLYGSLVPREFWIDSAVVTDLDDEELEAMIANLRAQMLEAAREEPLALSAPKVIEHAN